ncbi:MAG: hypothetical protein L3J89_07415 [Gammaproteobacteria bacterium]|nr:hypothetical protein [Gammaproteobacteria bacterium]
MVKEDKTFESVVLPPQQQLLVQLGVADVDYVLMREPSQWADSGDIDILVRDVDECDELLKSWGFLGFSTDKHSKKYLKYDGDSGWWIHLDVVSAICIGGVEAPAGFVENLLSLSEVGVDGISRLNAYDEAILLIYHAALNKNYFSQRYMKDILQVDLIGLEERAASYQFLPMSPGGYIQLIQRFQSGTIKESDVVKAIQSSFPRAASGKSYLLARVTSRLKMFMKRNQAIVFLGPDGAGKSTITESLTGLRWPSVQRQFMGPARKAAMKPLFFFLLSFLGKLRERHTKGTPIGLAARSIWQFVCYVDFLERLYRHKWYWGSGGVVIFDRYACDMFFRKPSWLNEIIFIKLFPKPKFVFLCMGEPGLIYQRKPELTISEIENTIELYRKKLLQYDIPYSEVDTTSNTPADNIDQIVTKLISDDWYRN